MTDSDEDGFEDSCGVNLTGFLFGNIDESGNLESDVFDPESQKHLASLGRYVPTLDLFNFCEGVLNCRLAFGSILKDVIGEEVIPDSDYESQSQESEKLRPNNDFDGFYSEDQKSPSATDFFDINEYADDEVGKILLISFFDYI